MPPLFVVTCGTIGGETAEARIAVTTADMTARGWVHPPPLPL